ncbi:MAG TPA: T9SS type A sorting domain-containing protein [Candidatus Moranbacteria bacterium]|nr:T9SS type A sorting domain-containing protein [Candidatus Moranbacteria bacterium]
MHLGWIFRDDPNTIEFSLFYHNNEHKSSGYIAHKIDERHFPDVNANVDMYLGERVIGMIINNEYDPNYDVKCLGIREDNTALAQSQDSYVARTFYFGGDSRVPHKMEMRFHDLFFDENDYQKKFNSCDIMTWNLTEFNNGDNFNYTASKEIYGSVADRHTVQYGPDNPNKEYQKCIIHSGADISFTAGNKVELYPGFHAELGSTFSAEIGEAPEITIVVPNQFSEEIVYNVQNVSLFEVLIYLDSSRDSLVYSTQNYAENGYAMATINSELPVKNYYVVSTFYSGLGSHKTVNHEAFNNGLGLKNKRVTSSDDRDQYLFSIFPNPSTGKFEVSFAEGINYKKYEIISINGQVILSDKLNNKKKLSINLSDQPKGIYFLKLFDIDHVDVRKLLIN